jgi:hypothetical protein
MSDNISCQVFGVAQSIAVLLQTGYGFGKPLDTLSDSDIQSNLRVRLFWSDKVIPANAMPEPVCRDDPVFHLPRFLETCHYCVRPQHHSLQVAR